MNYIYSKFIWALDCISVAIETGDNKKALYLIKYYCDIYIGLRKKYVLKNKQPKLF